MAVKALASTVVTAQAANGTISTASAVITMSGTVGNVVPGNLVYDATVGAVLGVVASWPASPSHTLTLAAASLSAGSGSSDELVFLTPVYAVQWNSAYSVADLAALNAYIQYPSIDQGPHIGTNEPVISSYQPVPSVNQGVLYIPARMAAVRLFENDWIMVDQATGDVWVQNAATMVSGGSWMHN